MTTTPTLHDFDPDERDTVAQLMHRLTPLTYERPMPSTSPIASRHRSRLWVGGVGLTAVAASVAAVVLVVVGNGPVTSKAWAAVPTVATQAQQSAINGACTKWFDMLRSDGWKPTLPDVMPALTALDLRGSQALAIYGKSDSTVLCMATQIPAGEWTTRYLTPQSQTGTPSPSNPLLVDSGVVTSTNYLDSTTNTVHSGDYFTGICGRVDPSVAKVVATLPDGTVATATRAGSEFAVWFPGKGTATVSALDAKGNVLASVPSDKP